MPRDVLKRIVFLICFLLCMLGNQTAAKAPLDAEAVDAKPVPAKSDATKPIAATPIGAKPEWTAVVISTIAPPFESRSDEGDDPAVGTFNPLTASSKTFILSSKRKAQFAGAVAFVQGKLCRLKEKTVTIRRDEKAVQTLCVQPLGEKRWSTILGQDYIKAARTGGWDSYDLSLGVIAIYGDLFGVCAQGDRHEGGAGNENFFDLLEYRDRGGRLSELNISALPASIQGESQKQFKTLPEEQRENFSDEDKGYIIMPSNGGCIARFCYSGVGMMDRGFAYITNASPRFAIKARDLLWKKEYYATHSIPNKSIFVAVSPDGSAAVYANGGKLFWHSTGGAARLIGAVDGVRGIQWIDASKLPATNSQALTTLSKPL